MMMRRMAFAFLATALLALSSAAWAQSPLSQQKLQ
jgi:hypothetical protein